MSEVPLRRLFVVVSGGTPTSDPENWDGDIVWATPVDLAAVNGGVLRATQRSITALGLQTGSALVPSGSLIVSTRAPIGYVAETSVPTAFNQGCRGLVPRADVDVRFFRYQLVAGADRLQAQGQGSTFMELSTDGLASFPLLAPSRDEQRAVSDYLDAETARIDEVVARRRGQAALLNHHFDSYLDATVRELIEIDGARPLKRFAELIEQGWSPECEAVPADPHEWGVLKTSAVAAGAFDGSQNKRLPPEVSPDPRWIVRDGDLLVVRGSGSPSAVGRAAIARTEGRMLLLADLLYRVRLRTMNPEFAAFVLRSKYVRDQLEAAIRTDVGMTRKIRTKDLANVLVPEASESAQKAAVRDLITEGSRVAEARAACDDQVNRLLERRLALITAAVAGDLEIPGLAA